MLGVEGKAAARGQCARGRGRQRGRQGRCWARWTCLQRWAGRWDVAGFRQWVCQRRHLAQRVWQQRGAGAKGHISEGAIAGRGS
jgi:hypothetical protein